MEKRKIISTGMKPGIIKKLDNIVDQLNDDTSSWGSNKHTQSIGYYKKKVTRADVLEILINHAYKETQDK